MAVEEDAVLKTIRQAALLSRATTGRQGMLLHLPPTADSVVVAGDMHGHTEHLKAILAQADLDAHPQRHLVLQEFVHGPRRYPAGGCTSHRLLDLLCALKVKYPQRLHLMLGNHELSQWTGRKIAKDDVYYNDLFEEGVRQAYGERAQEVLEAYDLLFASMLLAVRTPNRVWMSHSLPEARQLDTFDFALFSKFGLTEDDLGKGSSVYRLVWGRDTSESTARQFLERIDADFLITGHIAQPEGFSFPNPCQLILDCMNSPAAIAVLSTRTPVSLDVVRGSIQMLP